jgi:hypothetical protein
MCSTRGSPDPHSFSGVMRHFMARLRALALLVYLPISASASSIITRVLATIISLRTSVHSAGVFAKVAIATSLVMGATLSTWLSKPVERAWTQPSSCLSCSVTASGVYICDLGNPTAQDPSCECYTGSCSPQHTGATPVSPIYTPVPTATPEAMPTSME